MTINAESNNSTTTKIASTTIPSTPLIKLHHTVTLKLTRDNYLLWKTQLVPYLKGQNLYGYVDDTIPSPPAYILASPSLDAATAPLASEEIQPNPAFALWVQQDQLILSAIISSLSEELLPHVVGDFTARQVWDILAQLFCSHTRAKSTQLKYNLSQISKRDDSIDKYYDRIQDIATTLAAIGEPLRESDHLAFLLAGLDSTYDPLVASIHTMLEPPSLPVVYELLKSQEKRIEKNNMPIVNPSANLASRTPHNNNHRGHRHHPQQQTGTQHHQYSNRGTTRGGYRGN